MSIRKTKIKILSILAMIFIASIFYCNLIFAKNNVSNINMDVLIHDNGSATITESWTGTFNEGTEVYIPIEDKSLIVRNLKVQMNGQEFALMDRWKPESSFEAKKYRCGINRTNSGVELCFGITSYGNNVYQFSYDIDPLVKSFTDADGFNFQFLNPNMSVYPSDATIRIRFENGREISEDNAQIWGFGFNGEVQFASGYAVAYTKEKLSGSNNVTLMLRLYKGIIAPNVRDNRSFDDVQNAAFVGSDYAETIEEYKDYNSSYSNDRGLSSFEILFFGLIGMSLLGMITSFISNIKKKNELKWFYNDCDYYRDVPNGGDIIISHVLFKDFDIWRSKESNVIGAVIMKMINDGNLEPLQETSYGFFGNEKTSTSLKVGKAPEGEIERELYDIIIKAAGSDGVLQEKELKKYAENNYDELNNYFDSLDKRGRNLLNLKNCYNKIYGKRLDDLSEDGQKELSEVYGLRKFLDEFTLISERGIKEGIIWENLIVYATLFGIATKVFKELKEVYPDKIVDIEKFEHRYVISNLYYRNLYFMPRNMRNMEVAMKAARGFGGATSIGGGGGFSGGGSGGGTR